MHRPRYDDWSWAKGKLDPGEDWAVAAVRETEEETGLVVRLGPPLPEARYTLLGRDGTPDDKVVRYWSARVTGGDGHLLNEIDEVVWLDVPERARPARLRPRPRPAARPGAAAADRAARHLAARAGAARPRRRPRATGAATTPSARSTTSAAPARSALSGVLTAYGVTRVVTSPSERCLRTVEPYAVSAGVGCAPGAGCPRRASQADPDQGPPPPRAGCSSAASRPLLCTHGPVLPALLDDLASAARPRRRGLGRGRRGVRRGPRRAARQGRGPGLPRRRHRRGRPGRRRGAPPPLSRRLGRRAVERGLLAHATSP